MAGLGIVAGAMWQGRRVQRGLLRAERALLSAGLGMVAVVADWLLARRLAHDRTRSNKA